MPTYVGLYKWTAQGVKDVKDSVNRARQAIQAFQAMGARDVNVYWTEGPYDLVSIGEFPDEETAQVAMLTLARAGNVQTLTMRAFNAQEMQRILDRVQ